MPTQNPQPPVAQGLQGRPATRWIVRALLIAYPVLVLGAALSHRGELSAVASVVLISLLLWPALAQRRPAAIAAWCCAIGGGGVLALCGRGDLNLLLLPVAINAAVAWWFGRSLRRGQRPLIARAILAIEGPKRLALPEVAVYARRLTTLWCLLLAGLAGLLLVAAVLAVPGGVLASVGVTASAGLPQHSVLFAGQIGVYLLLGLFMGLEYLFRLWRFRHLPHPPLREFVQRLLRNWRTILHDDAMPARDPR